MILRSPILWLFLFFLVSLYPVAADPALLLVKITPQVVEKDQTVSWEQPLSMFTSPGKPVVVNIDAAPLTIRVTITPFVRGKDFLLVVQGDVKQVNGARTHGVASLQSLLVPPGESIIFFPLGREPADTGHQMVVKMQVEFEGE